MKFERWVVTVPGAPVETTGAFARETEAREVEALLRGEISRGAEGGAPVVYAPGEEVPEEVAEVVLADFAPESETDEITGERTRTPEEEAAHDASMERWARAYDELDGAPEGEDDR